MVQTRKHYSAELKRKVALEALKGEKTLNELTSVLAFTFLRLRARNKQALEGVENAFSSKGKQKNKGQETKINEFYRQLDQVIAERDWLRKKPLK